MRAVSKATCTSHDPVSLVLRAFDLTISAFWATVKVMMFPDVDEPVA
jgi:hypothetical protein